MKARFGLVLRGGLLGVFLVASLAFFSAAGKSDSLRAGVAKAEITPKEATPLWGYKTRGAAFSEGKSDPLYAVCLVLEFRGERIAIVTLDLGRTPSERVLTSIRRRLQKEVRIETSFVMASHTHHGPVMEFSRGEGRGEGRFDASLRYYRWLEDEIVRCAAAANRNLQPATLFAGASRLKDFNFNRQTILNPTSDDDLTVLRVDAPQGKTLALLVNFAAHPVLTPETTRMFSADFVGHMKKAIERDTGAVALFAQGAAGDQSANDTGAGAVEYGERLAKEALKLAMSLEPWQPSRGGIESKEQTFRFQSRIDLSDAKVRKAQNEVYYPELVQNYADEYSDGIRPRLSVATLGSNLAFVGVSGEFFSDHALRLKQRLPGVLTFFFGYCNGYHQYFPTIEAAAKGGYGTDPASAPAALGSGEAMMNTALIWIYEMLKASDQ